MWKLIFFYVTACNREIPPSINAITVGLIVEKWTVKYVRKEKS